MLLCIMWCVNNNLETALAGKCKIRYNLSINGNDYALLLIYLSRRMFLHNDENMWIVKCCVPHKRIYVLFLHNAIDK